jgi:PHD/YefM family antitoxin component YafN of YafNO toxin-antitoxin module
VYILKVNNLCLYKKVIKMQTINIEIASQNLTEYQNSVLDSKQQIKIVSKKGNTVLISEDEWNKHLELIKMINDGIPVKRVLQAHQNRINNIKTKKYSISEVFDDL